MKFLSEENNMMHYWGRMKFFKEIQIKLYKKQNQIIKKL